jgi:1,4-alpha-glucan branching enzyme
VHDDRSVTFTLRAPEATDVKVSGDFTQNSPTMTKYLDGTWTATAGPLRPTLYNYAFTAVVSYFS